MVRTLAFSGIFNTLTGLKKMKKEMSIPVNLNKTWLQTCMLRVANDQNIFIFILHYGNGIYHNIVI